MKKFIPTLFTLANICCGFMAVAIGDLKIGSFFLIIAIFFDTFDGILARALNVQSEMGKELDSLADMISFGIAPAYLYTLIAPVDHWFKYVAPCFFIIGAALRLAKFNLLPSSKHFYGLPVPVATLFLVGIFIGVQYERNLFLNTIDSTAVYFLIPFVLMMLMLSSVRMFSLKNIDKGLASNFFPILCFVIFVLMLIVDFRVAFSGIVLVYIFLSILEGILYPN